MADQPDDRWLSYTAAAEVLGVTRQAVALRVKRGALQVRAGNRGNKLVRISAQVPVAVTAASVTASDAIASPTEPRQKPASALETVPLSVLNSIIASHSEAQERQERQRREHVEQLSADHATEIARLREDADKRLDRLCVEHQVEIAHLRTDADLRVEQQRASMRWERVWFVVVLAVMVVLVLAPLFARYGGP